MKKLLFGCLFLLFFTVQNFAQKTLLFLNTNTHKTIEVSEGQTLSVQYRGYNNQIYHFKNMVSLINDSTILLGNISEEQPAWSQKLSRKFEPNYRIIAIKDIVTFRRITIGRSLGKSLLTTSVMLGTFFGTIDLFRNNQLGTWQTALLSLGIGISTSVVNAIILPENPKYKVKEGWVISVRN
jgi:hypothetical protein